MPTSSLNPIAPREEAKVRPIVHRTNRTDDADRLLKDGPIARSIFDKAKAEWPSSRHALEHPTFDVAFENCRFEVNVAQREGDEDRISITIRYPEEFPLQSSGYALNMDKGSISGSEKKVFGEGHAKSLRLLALAAA